MSDTPSTVPPKPRFNRVTVDRASQVIVDQIKQLIQDGSLRPGDRLPNERELCQQFGVSRVTVREALRVLEATGLIQVRVGAQGGSFLTAPSPELVGDNLAQLLSLSPITAAAVTEARQIFELGVLPLAIERATPEDIVELRQLVADAKAANAEGIYSTDMSAAFHVRLAGCTHNPAIEAMMHSFRGSLLLSLHEAKNSAANTGTKGVSEHGAIIDALEAKDLDGARTILERHLKRTAARLARVKE
ncbi:FadR/GntR family transcriptional regulator [Microbacterium pseudoresistens]|uniref:DNA-binding FadR family transcriptional regulator n=1 Tax=Microbacterium pseudoresistens TaxID=640634 RepID=A0A7Y9EVU1_9MICO|nr:FadR/GntR family transcriptional regulator [Microbacterium pseudoresistens]NYD54882.1 DNA-binding FadR family transcriptional regulator [Microbacterium pseudoresistens]